jgi:SAM-dependent methyltransferase
MSSHLTFKELPCVLKPANADEVDPAGYYSANPDVKKAGMDAREHFRLYGCREGRIQWENEKDVNELRDKKIQALKFKRKPSIDRRAGESINFLSRELIEEFQIPDSPPVSANQYGEFLNQEFRDHPTKLFLDVGAGLRHKYFSNVINTEIYPSLCTDVLCVGEDLPFEDNQFDKVMSFAVLEHTRRPWEVAREMCRVLKPGGELLIDYPFLQPVHGYPHHYFNATPQGHRSLFEEYCNIQSVDIRPNQTPIYSLWWILQLWKTGLSASDATRFEELRIKDILASNQAKQAEEFFCKNLSLDVQKLIAAGSTLVATKKI